jgi:copper chaperone
MGNMKKEFIIEGMSCSHCVMAVKKEISKLSVNNLKVEIGNAQVEFDESKLSETKIKQAITEAGYIVVETK